MRQWLVNPQMLCRKHLLGEHFELHLTVGSILKNKNLNGFLSEGFIDLKCLHQRHEELSKEMKDRGYNHKSPLPHYTVPSGFTGSINIDENVKELMRRCPECRQRINSLIRKGDVA